MPGNLAIFPRVARPLEITMLWGPAQLQGMLRVHSELCKASRRNKKKKNAVRTPNRRCETCHRQRCQCHRDENEPERSVWWKFIQRETVQDPRHRDGKLFRRRFRVPYSLFRRLVDTWREKQWPLSDTRPDGTRKRDAVGRHATHRPAHMSTTHESRHPSPLFAGRRILWSSKSWQP